MKLFRFHTWERNSSQGTKLNAGNSAMYEQRHKFKQAS